MARKKRDDIERVVTTFTIEKDLITSLKIIAAFKQVDVSQAVEDLIRDLVKKEKGNIEKWVKDKF